MTRVSVIVPCFNERATVARVVRETCEAFSGICDYEIVVVDDGSTDDGVGTLPESPTVRVVRHGKKLGKGAAVLTGFEQAKGDIIAFQDADAEYSPSALVGLVTLVLSGEATFAFGVRRATGRWPLWHRMGNAIFSTVVSLVARRKLWDVTCGQKAVAASTLRRMPFVERGFGFETELVLNLPSTAVVRQVSVPYCPRTREDGKKLGWRDVLQVFSVVLGFLVSRLWARSGWRRAASLLGFALTLLSCEAKPEDQGRGGSAGHAVASDDDGFLIETVHDLSGGGIGWLTIDGDSVYWPQSARVWTGAVSGEGEPREWYLPTGELTFPISSAAGRLFWLDASRLHTARIEAPEAVQEVADVPPSAIAATPYGVIAAEWGCIRLRHYDDQLQLSASVDVGDGVPSGVGLTLLSVHDGLPICAAWTSAFVFPEREGTPTRIYSSARRLTGLAVRGEHVFLADQWEDENFHRSTDIVRVGKDGGEAVRIAVVDDFAATGLLVGERRALIWARSLWSVDLERGTVHEVSTRLRAESAPIVAGDYVYWSTYAGGDVRGIRRARVPEDLR